MKKIFFLLAAIIFCAGLTLPAFAWGKGSGKKPAKAAQSGKGHAKKKGASKGKKQGQKGKAFGAK